MFVSKFSEAFVPFEYHKGAVRYLVRTESCKVSLTDLFRGKTIVKVAGKNGIPEALDMYAQQRTTLLQAIQALGNKDELALVFDGDNYEPNKTPFSIFLRDVAPHVSCVLAVKKDAGGFGYSSAFVLNWAGVDNLYFAQVDEEANAWSMRPSSYVLNLYSLLYRLRPSGDETTGYRQLKAQMQGHSVMTLVEGVVLITM